MSYNSSEDPSANVTFVLGTVDKIAYELQTYYLWAILCLGFPGNCATIVTVMKMAPARSLTIYIACLAIVDNIAIVNKLLVFALPDHGIPIGNFGCKFLGYLGNVLVTIANWLLVAMSIERFAAVWFPFKVGQIWTFRKTLVGILFICVPLFVLFLPLVWMIKFVDDTDLKIMYCSIHPEYRFFMMHVWYWINVVIYAVLPCIFLFVFNILIIRGLRVAGKAQNVLNHSDIKTNPQIDKHRPITIMLVTAAVTLVILTIPRCIMLLLSPYWTPSQTTVEGSVHYLVDTLAFVLSDSTHAINFYIYSLSTKRFRRHFIDVVLCRRKTIANMNLPYVSLSFRSSSKFRIVSLQMERKQFARSST